jgi:hypothetical protein
MNPDSELSPRFNGVSERTSIGLFPLGSKNPASQGGFFNFFNGLPGATR